MTIETTYLGSCRPIGTHAGQSDADSVWRRSGHAVCSAVPPRIFLLKFGDKEIENMIEVASIKDMG